MRWPIAIFLLCAWAAAQQPTEVHESYPTSTRAGSAITIPAGTQIPLKLSQGISTKSAKVGDPVYAETVFPVTLNNHIVIPAGTYVQGRISEINRPGRVKGRAEFLMHLTSMIFKNGTPCWRARWRVCPARTSSASKIKKALSSRKAQKAKMLARWPKPPRPEPASAR